MQVADFFYLNNCQIHAILIIIVFIRTWLQLFMCPRLFLMKNELQCFNYAHLSPLSLLKGKLVGIHWQVQYLMHFLLSKHWKVFLKWPLLELGRSVFSGINNWVFLRSTLYSVLACLGCWMLNTYNPIIWSR